MENIYDIMADMNGDHPIKAGEARKKYDALMETSVVELDISLRAANHLESIGVLFVRELLQTTEKRILAIPNVGALTIIEIRQKLWDAGICNRGDIRPIRPIGANESHQIASDQSESEVR